MRIPAVSVVFVALALTLPAAAESKVYLVCDKAGATPVAALAEVRGGSEVAVLAVKEGTPGACTDRSVREVRGAPEPPKAEGARVTKGAQQAGSAVASGASLLGGTAPGAGPISARLKEALADPRGVPGVDFQSPQMAPATREAVSNVLRTKHDTAKNSIMNIR
ncbi:MAG: hypothetical protein KatS3mg005_2671 [Bryobacteraceae bacterium]|nr:MAG: hypothetical protein KatS3mg005_2671 [Bryobacteraceae bacterium]